MRTIFYLLQKEFLQIFRNKMMIPIIFVAPIMQLLILSYAATFEIKNASIAFVDDDHSPASRELIGKFIASPFFSSQGVYTDYRRLNRDMKQGKVELFLRIPSHFGKNLLQGKATTLQVVPDAVNGSAANIMAAYSLQIIRKFNRNIIIRYQGKDLMRAAINIEPRYWFNPELNYKTYMVPGILVLLVTLIGVFLSGMNIVREKEIGTIEQLNVTPIKKHQFIIGKLFPFWIIALFDLLFGLLLSRFVFDIPILGSLGLIFSVASIYMLLVLGMGLFISTITETQQQAMFIAWFFMVIFIMLSGLFTPLEGMPHWAQLLNILNPIAYFIDFMRLVMLKGAGLSDVAAQVSKISIYAVSLLSLAIVLYRKKR